MFSEALYGLIHLFCQVCQSSGKTVRYALFIFHPFIYVFTLFTQSLFHDHVFWHCLKLWHVAFLTTYNSVWLFLVVCSCRHLVIYANSSTLSFLFCIFLHVLVIKNIGLQVHLMDGDILQRKAKQSQPQYSIENCLNFTQTKFPFTWQKHTITLNVCIIQIFLSRLVWYSF